MSARFRRAPLNISNRSAAKIWPRPRVARVVAFSLAAYGTCYTQVFFGIVAGLRVRFCQLSRANRARRFGACSFVCVVLLNLYRRGIAAPVMVKSSFRARLQVWRAISRARKVNGGKRFAFVVRCVFLFAPSRPQPPPYPRKGKGTPKRGQLATPRKPRLRMRLRHPV